MDDEIIEATAAELQKGLYLRTGRKYSIRLIDESAKKTDYSEEFIVFASTIYGEAAAQSPVAWRAIAHVIMNRVGKREWTRYKNVLDLINGGGFDAHDQRNAPYVKCFDYLKNESIEKDRSIEKFIPVIKLVYDKNDPDLTQGCQLYYSPKAQAKWHLMDPKKYRKEPDFVNQKVEEVEIPNLLQTDDFKFYRYKS